MKSLLIAMVALGMLVISGCVTPVACPCSEEEVCRLKEPKHLVLCKCGEIKGSPKCCDKKIPNSKETGFHEDSIRDRLLDNSNSMNLSGKEKAMLRDKKTVILCGGCGHIKGMPECCAKGAAVNPKTGFAENSIRSRMLGPYTD